MNALAHLEPTFADALEAAVADPFPPLARFGIVALLPVDVDQREGPPA